MKYNVYGENGFSSVEADYYEVTASGALTLFNKNRCIMSVNRNNWTVIVEEEYDK